jgi:hypothetical protein
MPLLGFPAHVPRFQIFPTPTPAPAGVTAPTWWLTDDAPRKTAGLKPAALAAILETGFIRLPGITSTVASASSSQVTVNTWSVYDPTAAPVGVAAGEFLPNFVPQWSDPNIPKRTFAKSPLPDTVNQVGLMPGEFLPNFVSQWQEHLRPVRTRPVNAALASADAAPVYVPKAANTIVGFSSSTIVRHSWSVHDQTAGPVLPPAVPPPPYIPAASDSTIVTGDVDPAWPVAKKVLPLPTSIVIAIPIVPTPGATTASSGPITINSWSVYDPTTGPVLPLPPATATASFAYASSGQITINTWSVHDRTIGPVLPTSAPIVPPSILGADWLEQSLTMRTRRKAALSFDPIAWPMFPIIPPPPPGVTTEEHSLPFFATMGKLKSF